MQPHILVRIEKFDDYPFVKFGVLTDGDSLDIDTGGVRVTRDETSVEMHFIPSPAQPARYETLNLMF